LADFQSSYKEFESEGITIVAASVDSVEKTKETVQKGGITFAVGYGLVAEEVSKTTGAYYEPAKKFLHATGFIIRPDNRVSVACYSTGPVGRFTAKDVLNLIRFYKSRR
jgi:alkyl hydroperoxide reductase subunit AhpC